jgi:hypothetical protein
MRLEQIVELKTAVESHFSNDIWLDFEVLSYTSFGDGVLTIAASRDFSYYHNMEIRFVGVRYFSGVFSWKSSPSRMGILVPDRDAPAEHRMDSRSDESSINFIDDDDGRITVLAESASIDLDTVYYYKRTPLAENERIAAWVPG